jgi:sugar O-acyltransferase (sialic acid O-acetyltransferase NeuD family)
VDLTPHLTRVLIISAGGFGRTVLNTSTGDIANGKEWQIVGFLDSRTDLAGKAPLPVLGDPLTYQAKPGELFICALGDPRQRRRFAAPLLAQGARFMNLRTGLYKTTGTVMGQGCLFEPEVRMGVDTHIGDFVIVQSTTVIGYECKIGSYTTIGSFVFIGGRVEIGNDVLIHPHATILPGVKIGDGAVIGAGSVVIKDVPPGVTMIGNPAKVFQFK